ncbi:ADP-ribosylation factor-like [Penaeus japonicus]|uniref:ADP-ribosylation factor-like n=1 Tax=Penaeus japonicus TaxID=27405 RepID=UPI001C711879|nr:ADP-ribosylation factor-like [Penaeus japonicus]
MGSICTRGEDMVVSNYIPSKILIGSKMSGIVFLNSGPQRGREDYVTLQTEDWKRGPDGTHNFNIETITYREFSFTMWDIGGDTATPELYKYHVHEIAAIIYVVDSDASGRLEEARRQLDAVLSNDEISGIPLLVLANKHDQPGATSVDLISEALTLRNQTRPWHVQPTSAVTSQGINEGMDWLLMELTRKPYI